MSVVNKILVPQARLEIFNSKIRTGIDLKGWIANQYYFVDDDIDLDTFELRPTNSASLFAAYANDCNRMAIAAIESAVGLCLDSTLRDSGAWGVIRAYYAAFFAVHSILRMYGVSCTQLEQVHADKIYQIAQLVSRDGGHARLQNGFYSIEITGNPTVVRFAKYKDSHAGTWRRFLELVDSLSSGSRELSALSQDKLDAISLLTRIRSGITKSSRYSTGNWLSKLRNNVNYQHTHGVWFPYEQKVIAQTCIPHMSRAWKLQASDLPCSLGNGEIEYFFEVVLLIMSFFRELLVSCHKKSGSTNPVFVNGAIRLLNTLQMV
jgi:hypothetical protein